MSKEISKSQTHSVTTLSNDNISNLIRERTNYPPEKQEEVTEMIRFQIISREEQIRDTDIISTPTIQSLVAGNFDREQDIKTIIREMILLTASVLKFSERLSFFQASVLATDLYDMFKYESTEDFYVMFRNARRGVYGDLKGRFDSSTLFGQIVPAHLEMKAELREKEIQNQKLKNTSSSPMSEEEKKNLEFNIKMLDQMAKKIQTDKLKRLAEEEQKQKNSRDAFYEKKVTSHSQYVDSVRNSVYSLKNHELMIELRKAKSSGEMMKEFYEIYLEEQQKRISQGTYKIEDEPYYQTFIKSVKL